MFKTGIRIAEDIETGMKMTMNVKMDTQHLMGSNDDGLEPQLQADTCSTRKQDAGAGTPAHKSPSSKAARRVKIIQIRLHHLSDQAIVQNGNDRHKSHDNKHDVLQAKRSEPFKLLYIDICIYLQPIAISKQVPRAACQI